MAISSYRAPRTWPRFYYPALMLVKLEIVMARAAVTLSLQNDFARKLLTLETRAVHLKLCAVAESRVENLDMANCSGGFDGSCDAGAADYRRLLGVYARGAN